MLDRTIYKKPPIDQVICQLMFPTIMRIECELPVSFQEKIRVDYPIYKKQSDAITGVDLNPMSIPSIYQSQTSNHFFLSEDSSWQVNLTQNFLALSTRTYTSWEQFKSKLGKLIEVLYEIYNVPFFDRIGLRYVDVFVRSKYGLDKDTPWTDCINNEFLGPFAFEETKKDGYSNISDFVLNSGIKSKIITRIVIDGKSNLPIENREKCLMIDSDSYCDVRIQKNEVDSILTEVHKTSSYLLRKSITNKMHSLMEPDDEQ